MRLGESGVSKDRPAGSEQSAVQGGWDGTDESNVHVYDSDHANVRSVWRKKS